MRSRAHRCSLTGQPTPHLVEIQRLLGIPRLDEQFVGQGAIFRAIAVRVAGNASRSPVLVECSLDTCRYTGWVSVGGDCAFISKLFRPK